MTQLASVFASNNGGVITAGTATLAGTQQLTNTSATIADTIIVALNKSLETDEEGKALAEIQKSMSDMNVLDSIITTGYDLNTVDIAFLKELDEATLDGMLKSQQSKRSRCKSKEMTADNYKSMMTAAIAEGLIRLASGKEKGSTGGRASGDVAYSPERLAQLAADQEALRKEIRNVQSKKSIMKSKAGFSETDDRWQALLVAEAQLKGVRSDAPAPVVLKDTLRDDLKEFLAELDEQTMKAADLKETIAYIKRQVWSDVTTDSDNNTVAE